MERDLVTVHVRLERLTHDALRAAAAEGERPLSATIRRQLRRWLISTGHLKAVVEPVEARRAE